MRVLPITFNKNDNFEAQKHNVNFGMQVKSDVAQYFINKYITTPSRDTKSLLSLERLVDLFLRGGKKDGLILSALHCDNIRVTAIIENTNKGRHSEVLSFDPDEVLAMDQLADHIEKHRFGPKVKKNKAGQATIIDKDEYIKRASMIAKNLVLLQIQR